MKTEDLTVLYEKFILIPLNIIYLYRRGL